MSNIEKIRSEIERLKSKYRHNGLWLSSTQSMLAGAKIEAMNELLLSLDSLQQEQQEEPDTSLEEVAKEYAEGPECTWVGTTALEEAFIAGAKWQKEQDTRDMFMSDNRHFNKVYELGKKDMKEQMLKDAVDGEILMQYSGCLCAKTIRAINEDKFKLGDKVRIIIVKED